MFSLIFEITLLLNESFEYPPLLMLTTFPNILAASNQFDIFYSKKLFFCCKRKVLMIKNVSQMAVIILWRPKLRSAFNQLLISLCITDTIFLISNVLTAREAFGYKGNEWMNEWMDNYFFLQISSVNQVKRSLDHLSR